MYQIRPISFLLINVSCFLISEQMTQYQIMVVGVLMFGSVDLQKAFECNVPSNDFSAIAVKCHPLFFFACMHHVNELIC